MKIGLVFDDSLDKPDGVQQYVLALGSWLAAQGHEVHYLVGETKRRDIAHLHSLSRNLNVRFNGNRLSMPLPANRAAIRRLLAAERFDVLHVQLPYSPFLAQRIIAEADAATAVVGTFHVAPDSAMMSLGTSLLGRWLAGSLQRFSFVASVSTAAQAFAAKTFKLDSAVVPNVFDYHRFQAAKPYKRYQDTIPTVLFLGRLVPRKGCQLLLSAVAELRQLPEAPAFRLVICGRGPLEQQLRRFVAEQRLETVVEFAGYVEEADKPRYYASADVAVFPSRGGESFGIVLLEAMASGRAAVLAGDNSGYRAVMAPRPELLFDAASSHDLAVRLEAMLRADDARRQAAQWGERYSRQFDTATIGQRWLEIYRQALRSRGNVR